jgi:Fe-S oxidoreductase
MRELAREMKPCFILRRLCFLFTTATRRLRAFINLLNKAKVNFGVLGFDETCCGETARRMGNEYLFQYSPNKPEAMGKIKFNRIVTQCPHCFNTLENEYLQFGSNIKCNIIPNSWPNYHCKNIKPNGNGSEGTLDLS